MLCKDLRAGDIMLKVVSENKGFVEKAGGYAIRFLEKKSGQVNPDIIHAGVMSNSVKIVEASGRGIIENDLTEKDKGFGYIVFRPRNRELGQCAGNLANLMSEIHKKRGSLPYSVLGAFGSLSGGPGAAKTPAELDQMFDRILSGMGHAMFCSQFVVYVYQYAGAQCKISVNSLFATADGKVSPSSLASSLVDNIANFEEAGYMMPNER